MFREAIALRVRVLGPTHPSVSDAQAGYARFLHLAGEDSKADSLFRVILPVMRKDPGDDHTKVAQAELNWALVRASLGDHDGAAARANDALRIRRLAGGGETTLVGLTLADLARLALERGDFERADSLYHAALEIVLRSYPPDHFDVRRIRAAMADFYDQWGKPDLAAESRAAAGGR